MTQALQHPMTGTVKATQTGPVLATLENPPLALMDGSTVEGIASVLARVERDPAIGGVVLTGSHPTRFLAHYDVGELLDVARSSPSLSPRAARMVLRATRLARRLPRADRLLRHTRLAGVALLERIHEVLLWIQRSPAVWIAALNGSAPGRRLRAGTGVRPAVYGSGGPRHRPARDDARLPPRGRGNTASGAAARAGAGSAHGGGRTASEPGAGGRERDR